MANGVPNGLGEFTFVEEGDEDRVKFKRGFGHFENGRLNGMVLLILKNGTRVAMNFQQEVQNRFMNMYIADGAKFGQKDLSGHLQTCGEFKDS